LSDRDDRHFGYELVFLLDGLPDIAAVTVNTQYDEFDGFFTEGVGKAFGRSYPEAMCRMTGISQTGIDESNVILIAGQYGD